jgi:hypothetical protein
MPDNKGQNVSKAIKEFIDSLMQNVMQKVLIKDPFIVEKFKAEKPLYAALVPNEIFKGSHFERRFVTPFGGVWEKLCVIAAQKSLGFAELSKTIMGTIGEESLRRISEVLNTLEHKEPGKSRVKPNWTKEIEYIKDGGGELIPVSVVCDVYAEDKASNKKYSFELKSPLPNSDISKVSKEKLLKLYSMTPKQIDGAFFALPYNPYGKKENYSWSFPQRWFDMKNDKVVLIGDEFWDFIGGKGTYQLFINEINKLGKGYRIRIYKEYLEIEPPEDVEEYLL